MHENQKTKSGIAAYYAEEENKATAEISRLKKKNRIYITLELTTFCLAITAMIFFCLENFNLTYATAAIILLAAYILTRTQDVRNSNKIDEAMRIRTVYRKEGEYMHGDFSGFDDGSRYLDPQHAFTFDLDMFGHDSLFNRIDRTVTTGGSNVLASLLSSLLTSRKDVERRRLAICELSADEKWLAHFKAKGNHATKGSEQYNGKIDSDAILKAVEEVKGMDIAPKAGHTSALVAAWAAITGFAAMIILSLTGLVPGTVAVLWGVVQMFAVIGLNSKSLHKISRAAEKLHAHLHAYGELLKYIDATEYKAEELKSLKEGLDTGGNGALKSFAALSEILKSLDRRGNFLGLVLFNMFALSDYFLVRRFLKWQSLYMDRFAEWISCVSRFDAFVSLATFRYNEPAATDADVVDADAVVYEGKGLYHPFLGDKAVRNDFTIADGNYYIITGANMAGKSTFLRSIGVNYVLAMNGMPVFADSLRVSPFNLFSSMRTTDDLSRGISYFNAELLRLRQLIESCRRASHTLIILDEILKGTNSLDKLNGSRLFLQSVAKLPVTGIIATHDLELSKMEDECPERFHNWCFEIELADNITYTYKVTRGVARNQNATFLLKNILTN